MYTLNIEGQLVDEGFELVSISDFIENTFIKVRKGFYVVTEPFKFSTIAGNGVVPTGFTSDGVTRLSSVIEIKNLSFLAAIVHDFIYYTHSISKSTIDDWYVSMIKRERGYWAALAVQKILSSSLAKSQWEHDAKSEKYGLFLTRESHKLEADDA